MRKRLKFIHLSLIFVIITCTVAACSNPYKEKFDHSESDLGQRDESDLRAAGEDRAYGYTLQGKDHHNNTKMHLSLDTGTKLAGMQGIHIAHVLVTDANAYVAVVLDASAIGTLESGTPHSMIGGNRDGRPFQKDGELKTEIDAPFTTPNEADISTRLKQKIALKVRELNPHVNEVFISANEEFNTLMGRYRRLQWMGESLDSHVSEFNNLIPTFFPLP